MRGINQSGKLNASEFPGPMAFYQSGLLQVNQAKGSANLVRAYRSAGLHSNMALIVSTFRCPLKIERVTSTRYGLTETQLSPARTSLRVSQMDLQLSPSL